MSEDLFDIVILGGGSGGYARALRARNWARRSPSSKRTSSGVIMFAPRVHPHQSATARCRSCRLDAREFGLRCAGTLQASTCPR